MGELKIPDSIKNNLPEELREGFIDDLTNNIAGINAEVRLPQILVNHQNASFIMPSSEGGTLVKEIEGIIVHQQRINGLWENIDPTDEGSAEKNRLICSSLNAKEPEKREGLTPQAELCIHCKFNQFRTAKRGTGKACKNMVRTHVIISGEILPFRLTIPPSSLVEYYNYVTTLTREYAPLIMVKTRFSLNKIDKGSMVYSKFSFKRTAVLPTEEYIKMKAEKEKYLAMMILQPIEIEEYAHGEAGDTSIDDIDNPL